MGGAWFIVVPITGAESEEEPAGFPIDFPQVNLLKEASPTIMEEWLITGVRIPLAIGAAIAGEGEVVATATLTMRRGGDIVWQETIEAVMPETVVKGLRIANTTFNADLNNPIPMSRGQTLTLDCQLAFNAITAHTGSSLSASSTVNAKAEQVGSRNEGTVQYESKTLSGHRTL